MKKISFIAVFLSLCCTVSAFMIIEESSYEAKNIDNNESKRIRSLIKIQRVLLEAVGLNILYTAKNANDSLYTKLEYFTPKEVGNIVKDECSVEILEERTKGDLYYVKAQISTNEDKVLSDFASRNFTDEDIREIHNIYRNNKEIDKKLLQLAEEFDAAETKPEKEELRKKYLEIIRQNSPEKWFLRKSINAKLQELESKLPYLQNLNVKKKFENIISFSDSVSSSRKKIFFSPQEEINYYQKQAETDPQNPSFLISLGFAYLKDDKYEKADEVFRKALELDDKKAEAYFGLGIAAFGQKKYEKAVTEYEKAVAIDSLNDNYFLNLGVALDYLGKKDDAFDNYQKAIELNPQNARAYYNLGMIYQDLDNKEKANFYLKKAAQLGHSDAQNNLQQKHIKW